MSAWSTPRLLDAILTLPSATPSELALTLGDEKQNIHLLCCDAGAPASFDDTSLTRLSPFARRWNCLPLGTIHTSWKER